MDESNFSKDIEKHKKWISELISDFNWDEEFLLKKVSVYRD